MGSRSQTRDHTQAPCIGSLGLATGPAGKSPSRSFRVSVGRQSPGITRSQHPGCVHCSSCCLLLLQPWGLGPRRSRSGRRQSLWGLCPQLWALLPSHVLPLQHSDNYVQFPLSFPTPILNLIRLSGSPQMLCSALHLGDSPIRVLHYLPANIWRQVLQSLLGFLADYRKRAIPQGSILPGGDRAPSAVVLIGIF